MHIPWFKKEHETGFEPATLALARRYSTTEPLVQIDKWIKDIWFRCTFKTAHIIYHISIPIARSFQSVRFFGLSDISVCQTFCSVRLDKVKLSTD